MGSVKYETFYADETDLIMDICKITRYVDIDIEMLKSTAIDISKIERKDVETVLNDCKIQLLKGLDFRSTSLGCVYVEKARMTKSMLKLKINKVIFNDPATIVFWADGTKTVVKVQEDETFDPEKGLAMAIAKKALGNKGNYYNEINKWVDDYYKSYYDIDFDKCEAISNYISAFTKAINKAFGMNDK